jgi:CubicO group peptidase (beta-lactamase class C family)
VHCIDLAACILQVVSGKPFPKYAQEKVFTPLGMTHSTYDVARITADPDRAIGHAAGFDRLPGEVPMMGAGDLQAPQRGARHSSDIVA